CAATADVAVRRAWKGWRSDRLSWAHYEKRPIPESSPKGQKNVINRRAVLSDNDRMDAPKRTLVVEDDDDIAELLRLRLRDDGYDAVRVADGTQGMAALEQGGWHALVLDLMLPGVDGLEISRRARAMAY